MGLYRKATPDELDLRGARVMLDQPVSTTEAPKPIVSKRGRPIVSTGDPKRDKRNAKQRALMAKLRMCLKRKMTQAVAEQMSDRSRGLTKESWHGKPLWGYSCPVCKWWHMTSQAPRRRRA